MLKTYIRELVVGAVLLTGASASMGASGPILTFAPQTTSGVANPPELQWSPNPTLTLHAGPGATGNGDGALLAAGLAPGITINTPVSIAPLASLGEQNNGDGSTTFYDVSLVLTGLAPDARAAVFGPIDFQSLGAGTFAFYGSKVGGGPGVLLLSGNLGNTAANGLDLQSTGSHNTLVDNSVTYTGGLIYTKLLALGGTATGTESISLLNINPGLSINPGTGFLNNFTADATGLFTAASVPEPALGLVVIGGALVTALRRQRRAVA